SGGDDDNEDRILKCLSSKTKDPTPKNCFQASLNIKREGVTYFSKLTTAPENPRIFAEIRLFEDLAAAANEPNYYKTPSTRVSFYLEKGLLYDATISLVEKFIGVFQESPQKI